MSDAALARSVVRRKRNEGKVPNPYAALSPEDPWHDFRQVEVIDLKLEFQFHHSLGKCSRFFLELEHRRLLATRCATCGTAWMPPRHICPNDRAVTEWLEISGRGILAAATVCAYTLQGAIAPPLGHTPYTGENAASATSMEPLVLGYVALEGTSTLLLQRIRNYGGDARQLRAGQEMQVAWADAPVDHPMELFWFEPTSTHL